MHKYKLPIDHNLKGSFSTSCDETFLNRLSYFSAYSILCLTSFTIIYLNLIFLREPKHSFYLGYYSYIYFVTIASLVFDFNLLTYSYSYSIFLRKKGSLRYRITDCSSFIVLRQGRSKFLQVLMRFKVLASTLLQRSRWVLALGMCSLDSSTIALRCSVQPLLMETLYLLKFYLFKLVNLLLGRC